jgi:hypothetical protein
VYLKGVYGPEEFSIFKVFKKIINETTFADQVDVHQKLLENSSFELKNHYGKKGSGWLCEGLTLKFHNSKCSREKKKKTKRRSASTSINKLKPIW